MLCVRCAGTATATQMPKIACANPNDQRFLYSKKIKQAANPQISVNGASTGFGMCAAAKMNAVTPTAIFGEETRRSSRPIKKSTSRNCCTNDQIAYPIYVLKNNTAPAGA